MLFPSAHWNGQHFESALTACCCELPRTHPQHVRFPRNLAYLVIPHSKLISPSANRRVIGLEMARNQSPPKSTTAVRKPSSFEGRKQLMHRPGGVLAGRAKGPVLPSHLSLVRLCAGASSNRLVGNCHAYHECVSHSHIWTTSSSSRGAGELPPPDSHPI